MTREWWDLHYKTVFGQWNMSGDPRRPGGFGGAAGSLSGGLGEADLDAALACVEQLLGSTAMPQTQQRRRPRVVVLGCGLSPLVWSLADQEYADVICLEISRVLVDKFRCARAWGLRMLPRFLLSDIAAVPRRWRAGRRHRYLMPRSADLFLDENVINGLACTFPPSVAASSVHRALMGAQWLLRPRGKLLTFSSDKWKGNIISERVGLDLYRSLPCSADASAEPVGVVRSPC